jgi:hypothetical protein
MTEELLVSDEERLDASRRVAAFEVCSIPFDLDRLTSGLPPQTAEAVRRILDRIVAPVKQGGLGIPIRRCGPALIQQFEGAVYIDQEEEPTILISDIPGKTTSITQICTIFHQATCATAFRRFDRRLGYVPNDPRDLNAWFEMLIGLKGEKHLCKLTGIADDPDCDDYESGILETLQRFETIAVEFEGEEMEVDRMTTIRAERAVSWFLTGRALG